VIAKFSSPDVSIICKSLGQAIAQRSVSHGTRFHAHAFVIVDLNLTRNIGLD